MIYFVAAIALVGIGAGAGLAIWVARLKDKLLEAASRYAELAGRWNSERIAGELARAEVKTLDAQLEALRKAHDTVLGKIESGALCDADGVAAELRRGM